MRRTLALLPPCLLCFSAPVHAAALVREGFLGNSGGEGETRVTLAGSPAPGMGPVLDAEGALWERGGSRQLNRYARDGRLLAAYPLPESTGRQDQIALAGDLLVLRIQKAVYTLPVHAPAGTQPTRLPGEVDAMSANARAGRVAVFDGGVISWLDPRDGAREPAVRTDFRVENLDAAGDGTLHGFGGGKVAAWREGSLLPGFPREFHGERPQRLGRHWYSHAWHGTINRLNEGLEPDPGVVLGGASGSFIGYLPASGDLVNGRGLADLGGGLFAVSGLDGVVQLLTWNAAESRFSVARRLGGLDGPPGLALDADGRVWTPRGCWTWSDHAASPLTLGDSEPTRFAQPVVLGGRTLCLLKMHYSHVQLAHGPFLDADGLSHYESPGVKDFELPGDVSGAAAVPRGDGFTLVAVTRGGAAFELDVDAGGRQAGPPRAARLPGLRSASSLAWCGNRLLAAEDNRVLAFTRAADGAWAPGVAVWTGVGGLFLHSDGAHLAVVDAGDGALRLFDPALTPVASFAELADPGAVAVSGSRVVVWERGAHRLARFRRVDGLAPRAPRAPAAAPPAPAAAPDFDEADFVSLARPGGLPLEVALEVGADSTAVAVRLPAPDAEVELGLANDRAAFRLTNADARRTGARLDFRAPLGGGAPLRLAVAVRAAGQRERFGFQDHAPLHAPFAPDPALWAEHDLDAHRETVTARRQEIRIAFTQPADGKATLVIEDAEGRRVRNLVAGRPFPAGEAAVRWDGFDEQGRLVPPGLYRWRGVTHAGLRPEYRMNFANGDEDTTEPWGPNHSTLHHAVANGEWVFFAAPVTEGGWALVALDAEGRKVQGYEHQQGFGIQHNAIAVDERFLYCAQDGFPWGGAKGMDPGKPDWKAEWSLTVVRFDLRSGKLVEFPDKRRALVVDTLEVGPGSAHPDLEDFNLGGLAVKDGRLHVGVRGRGEVRVLDAADGRLLETVPLPGVRHLTAGSEVLAATRSSVVRLRDRAVLLESPALDIAGLTAAPDGGFALSDRATHQVRRYTAAGKPARVVGKPGGPYAGAYDPARMVRPAGLAFGADGKLWVTEERWNPKRVLAWDAAGERVVREKFGMPHYGGDGSGFDPENPRRWVGLGCLWDVDLDRRTARPTHVLSLGEGHLGHYEPHGYAFFREAGRTFLATRGKIALVSELRADGTLRDLVATAGTHHFAYAFNWDPPAAYIEAFYARWPAKRAGEKPGRKGEGKPWSQRGMGVLWVDRSGDGLPQPEEFDFCGDAVDYAGGSWGHLQDSLALTLPVADKTSVRLVRLVPRGFLANGTPDYPTLEEAVAEAVPVSLTPGHKRSGVATVRDRFGRFLFNSDPEMSAFDASGRALWTYPNRWSDVHGSHDAPLPEPGQMQGALAFLGIAPLDDTADVVFVNGNHGRCHVLTTDGLYLDEAFVDVRVSYQRNPYRLGGEIFGGSFGRGADGRTLVQIGHGPYRLYELQGLSSVRRIQGEVRVTRGQVAAAERADARRAGAALAPKRAALPGRIRWDRNGRFPVDLHARADATHLHLEARVADSSPWVNRGRDWTRLFATGDTVDFQFAAADAPPGRREPAPGDRRVLVAPGEGGGVAVLYDYRNPAGRNPVEFTSPWRGAKVDDVRRLTGARITVDIADGGYTLKAALPLAELGLELKPGAAIRADFGVTYGDAEGMDTNLRSYWSNPSTGLVDDIPGEVMLNPSLWGTLEVAP